jgi:hypothetical protein
LLSVYHHALPPLATQLQAMGAVMAMEEKLSER